MIIYGTNKHLFPAYNRGVIDWNAAGASTVVVTKANWYFAYPLLFEGVYFDWSPGAVSQFSGAGGITGGGGGSSGNLQFIFDGGSFTNGKVLAFNDGIINVPLIQITKATYPIVQACIQILKAVGKPGRTYKLDIVRNGVILFTVRSVYWGTQMATDTDPKYQIIDNQLRATSTPFL